MLMQHKPMDPFLPNGQQGGARRMTALEMELERERLLRIEIQSTRREIELRLQQGATPGGMGYPPQPSAALPPLASSLMMMPTYAQRQLALGLVPEYAQRSMLAGTAPNAGLSLTDPMSLSLRDRLLPPTSLYPESAESSASLEERNQQRAHADASLLAASRRNVLTGSSPTPEPTLSVADKNQQYSATYGFPLPEVNLHDVPDLPVKASVNPISNAPRPRDIVCGRGYGIQMRAGNQVFQDLIKKHRPRYLSGVRREKMQLSRAVVYALRRSGARFLRQDDATGQFFEIGDKDAHEKTSMAFRQLDPKLKKQRHKDSKNRKIRKSIISQRQEQVSQTKEVVAPPQENDGEESSSSSGSSESESAEEEAPKSRTT